MSAPQIGDAFPEGIVFSYVKPDPEASITSCGMPIDYDASEEFKGKKVVLFAVPGAFTPGCSAKHLPPFIEKRSELKAKGVDIVVCLASNDAWVMNAWAKANGIKDDSILFLTDTDAKFSSQYGWAAGGRTGRYALVLDDGKITYAEKEPGRGVTVSGAEAVLAKL